MDRVDREQTRRALIWVGLPVGVYLLVALIITWPLVTQITTHAAGAGYSDSYEIIRHGWWLREAVLDGENPFRQSLLAYPDGFTSRLMWAYPLRFGPTALLALVVPPLVAFNLVLLITLMLNGLTAYWLGMHLAGRRPLPALIGGLVFLAFPTMQGHASAGHLEILGVWPLPLVALCLWKIVREGAGWRTVAWGGVWVALASLGMVSQLIYLLFPLVLFFCLYHLFDCRQLLFRSGLPLRDQSWVKLGAMMALGGVLLLPFFGPLLTDAGRAELDDLREGGRVTYSADLLSFASLSPFGILDSVAPNYTRDVLGTNSTEGSAYLGIVAVGLAALALWRNRAARVWLVVALGAMIFSLGPLLKWRDSPFVFKVEGYESYVTLPWALLQRLPVIDATRTPGRFNMVTGFALSVLACLGAAVLLARVRRRGLRIELAAILGALILVEYQLFWPFLTVDARLPGYFRDLSHHDEVRAVLDVPVQNPIVAKTALYQQTVHHKPLIAGHVSRRTPQNPAVLAILDQAALNGEDGLASIQNEAVPYLLSQAGADRVIVHKAYAEQAALDRLRGILGAPEYEDARIAAFVVPRTDEPPPDLALAEAASEKGWSELVDTGAFEGRFMTRQGDWYFYTPHDQYGDLVFRLAPYRTTRRIGIWLDDHLIAGVWADGSAVRLPLDLTAGWHTLHFRAMDGCTLYPFDLTCWAAPELSASCARVDPPACISAAFEPPTWEPRDTAPIPLDVTLDGGLSLRAYTITREETTLIIRLFWQSDGPLRHSYALFAHVADPQTGEPKAQFDGFPVMATDAWDAGARWISEARIDIGGLPDGEYAINVGWFRPAENERLGVFGDRPWAADGIVHLDTVDLGG